MPSVQKTRLSCRECDVLTMLLRVSKGLRNVCTVSSVELTDWWIVLLTSLSIEASGALSFDFDLLGFGAVVFVVFLEPVMLQGLMCRDTLLWIIDKDLLEQIEEFAVELVVSRDDFLKSI